MVLVLGRRYSDDAFRNNNGEMLAGLAYALPLCWLLVFVYGAMTCRGACTDLLYSIQLFDVWMEEVIKST
jgi:hypothetical protein